jgi:uncharacterized protein YbaR (Trm112 family)
MSEFTFRPDEVKGFMGHQQVARPDRLFYVLEETPNHELLWEMDGYVVRDAVEGVERWTIHIVCPQCRNTLTIKSEKKQLRVSKDGLEVDEFACTWPGDFGSPTCGYRAALVLPPGDKRVVRDHNGVKRRVDAMFRRA